MRSPLLFALVLGLVPFAGCLDWIFGADDATGPAGNQGLGVLGNNTIDDLASRVSLIPRNYTMAGQIKLPPKILFVNQSVGPEANTAYEDRNDRSGNEFNTVRYVTDVSSYIPNGQPTEMRITAYTAPQPGSSADIDIYVNVPGTKTDFAGDNGDEFNWKWQIQRMTVNTIGVAGQPHEVGFQVANGKIVNALDVTLRIEFDYEENVVTPYHPWAFNVPANATGIVLESAKAGGQQNVRAKFAIIGPNDDLVQFVDYNDIAIPTESVFVPANQGPGEYIFYAFEMSGGFLRLYADVPVPDRAARPLPLEVRTEMLVSGPSPGVVQRDWARGSVLEGGSVRTPAQGGGAGTIAVATFPLRVEGVVTGAGPTAGTQVLVSGAKGLVAEYTRIGRVDTDQGRVGYTSEHWNTGFYPENLGKGDLSVTIVNNSPTLQAGYTLTTYKRA